MAKIINYLHLAPLQLTYIRELHNLLAERFRAAGHQYLVMLFSSPFDDQIRASAKHEYQFLSLDSRLQTSPKLVPLLARYLRENHVDLLMAHHMPPLKLTHLILRDRVARRRTKFVYFKRGAGRLIANPLNPRKYVNPLMIVGAATDAVVGISQAIVDNCINRGVSPRKVRLIYNGVLLSKFEGVDACQRIRAEFGIPDDHQVVTTIKDARPDVGIRDLVLSARRVLERLPRVTFLIVGGGVLTTELEGLAAELGIRKNFRFAGIRHDIPEILSASTITVDPSPVEAFGNVIVESMAGGVPVVAVRKWGPAEIIEDGRSGLLVDPGAPTDFSGPIVRLLEDAALRHEMGERCYQRVRERFTIERTVESTVALAEELLDGS